MILKEYFKYNGITIQHYCQRKIARLRFQRNISYIILLFISSNIHLIFVKTLFFQLTCMVGVFLEISKYGYLQKSQSLVADIDETNFELEDLKVQLSQFFKAVYLKDGSIGQVIEILIYLGKIHGQKFTMPEFRSSPPQVFF